MWNTKPLIKFDVFNNKTVFTCKEYIKLLMTQYKQNCELQKNVKYWKYIII